MKYSFCFSLVILLLTGCAGSFKPITQVDLEPYNSIKVTSHIAQEEVNKEVIISNAGANAGAQFGFIGALVGAVVDASVNDSKVQAAEKEIAPIRASLVDFDGRVAIEDIIQQQSSNINWATDISFSSEQPLMSKKISSTLKKIEADVWLKVTTSYEFSVDMKKLTIVSQYAIYDALIKPSKKRQGPKPFYSNSVTYHSNHIKGNTIQEKVDQWKANNGQLVRDEILQGASQIAEMIVLDLNGESVYTEEQLKKGRLKPIIIKEYENSTRKMLRNPNGTLISGTIVN